MLSVFPGRWWSMRMGDLEIELQLSVCIMSSCQYCIVRIDSTFYIWYVIWYTTHRIYDLEWCHGSYQAILYHLFLLWNRSLSEAVSIGNLPYISKASRHTIKSILSKKHCQWGPGNAMNSSHKHRLAVSSITPHWPARTSGAACGFHRKKGQVLQKLRAHWQVHDHHEEFLLHNGLMFAWFFWLWSEWKKDQDGSQPILSDLGAMFFLTLLNQKQINPSFMASQTKTFVEDPSNLTPFAKKTQPPNPIFCGSHPQHFVFTKPSYAARLPPLQYSKNKCSFSGPQIFSLISTGFWTWVKNSKPKHRKNMNWKHMIYLVFLCQKMHFNTHIIYLFTAR